MLFEKDKIKGLLLDFDMTLGNHELSAYRTIREILEEYITDIDPKSYKMEAMAQDMLTWNLKGMVKPAEMLLRLKEKYGYKIVIDDFNNVWSEKHKEHVELYDGVLETLAYLHEKYQICVVTDGNERRQKYKAEKSGILPYVDYVVTSAEVGHTKPHPAIYQKAMELMGTDAESTIFIGDQLFTDVWGAKRTGIRNILVKPIHPKEEIQIVLKRYLEKVVLFFYQYHTYQRLAMAKA